MSVQSAVAGALGREAVRRHGWGLTMRERLVTTFPILQIAFAFASGGAAFIGGLPEVAFDEAMGPEPLNIGWPGVTEAYKEYGGSTRFIPTLAAAMLRDPVYNAILLVLCLLACAAYWLSVQWSKVPTPAAPLILKADGTPSERGPLRRDTVMAYVSASGLIAVLVMQAWTWPQFSVPSRLKNLGHSVSSENLDLPASSIMHFVNGTEHYRGLYARFFGLAPNEPARFPSAEDGEQPIDASVKQGIRRKVPTDEMFSELLGFYEHLARITCWTLLLLLTFTLLGSSPAAQGRRAPLRTLLAAVLISSTLLHAQQWLSLALAFGRVYVPARTFQRVSQEASRNPETIGQSSHWPFWKLELTAEGAAGQGRANGLALLGYWPIRRAGEPTLEIWCLRLGGIERAKLKSFGAGTPRRAASGATVFDGVDLASYETACRQDRYSSLVIYDGYSEPLEIGLTGPGTVQ